MKEIKIDGRRYVLNEDFNGSEPCALRQCQKVLSLFRKLIEFKDKVNSI